MLRTSLLAAVVLVMFQPPPLPDPPVIDEAAGTVSAIKITLLGHVDDVYQEYVCVHVTSNIIAGDGLYLWCDAFGWWGAEIPRPAGAFKQNFFATAYNTVTGLTSQQVSFTVEGN